MSIDIFTRKIAESIQPSEEDLPAHQLRQLLDHLYDGCPEAGNLMLQINVNYRRAHRIFLWLARNKIKGRKIVEFFQNESGDLDGGGILSGVTYILNKIDGTPGRLLRVNELRKNH